MAVLRKELINDHINVNVVKNLYVCQGEDTHLRLSPDYTFDNSEKFSQKQDTFHGPKLIVKANP